MASKITKLLSVRIPTDVHDYYRKKANEQQTTITTIALEALTIGHDMLEGNKRVDNEDLSQMLIGDSTQISKEDYDEMLGANRKLSMVIDDLKIEINDLEGTLENERRKAKRGLKIIMDANKNQVDSLKKDFEDAVEGLQTLKKPDQVNVSSPCSHGIEFNVGDNVSYQGKGKHSIVKIEISNLGIKYRLSLGNGSTKLAKATMLKLV